MTRSAPRFCCDQPYTLDVSFERTSYESLPPVSANMPSSSLMAIPIRRATRVDSEQTTWTYAHFSGARATSTRNAIGAQDGVSSTWLVAPARSAELLR